MTTQLSPQEMQLAYQRRDPTYDGLFWLGVRTTGIFCRPTCPARKPLPTNVEYFGSAREALAAGYRPCKRCRPLQWDDQPEWALALLDEVDRNPTARIPDSKLRQRGIDPATARRHFQRKYGMTFQAYSRARRLGQALSQIREGVELDSVVFANGYESHSGFRSAIARQFGRPPGKCRDQDCVSLGWIRSPLGPLVAGATSQGICLLEFSDRRMLERQLQKVQSLFRLPLVPRDCSLLSELKDELAEYFSGKLRQFTVPLLHPGTPFQERVWQQLRQIPYGQTRSYEQLARDAGAPGAHRAAGRANGMNRIAIVVPCHRVVNKDGQLGGYGGGLRRKEFLLQLEQAHAQVDTGCR